MARKFTLVLLMLVLAGCLPVSLPGGTAAPDPGRASAPVAPDPTPALPSATPLPAGSVAAPPGTAAPARSGGPGAAPSTVGAPQAGTAGPTAGWQTFVSPVWHIAVDYPPAWTVAAQAAAVTFTGPTGEIVIVAPVETGGLSPEEYFAQEALPNVRCRLGRNPAGLVVRACFDTIGRTRTADVVIGLDAAPPVLTFATRLPKGGNQEVLEAMVAGARPAR